MLFLNPHEGPLVDLRNKTVQTPTSPLPQKNKEKKKKTKVLQKF